MSVWWGWWCFDVQTLIQLRHQLLFSDARCSSCSVL